MEITKSEVGKREYKVLNYVSFMNLPFYFNLVNKLSIPKQISINSSCVDKMTEVFGSDVEEFINYMLDNIQVDKVKEYEQFEK